MPEIEWMVSATWGTPTKDFPPPPVAGYFYRAAHGVVDEASARKMAAKCATWESNLTVRIWTRVVPDWEEVNV